MSRDDFLRACSDGNLDRVKSSSHFPFPPCSLQYAITSGNLELCKWLVANGDESLLNWSNDSDWSILHTALAYGHEEIVRWILTENLGFTYANLAPYQVRFASLPTEAFLLAVRFRMWWALPHLIRNLWTARDLKHVLWNCRDCIEHVVPALPRSFAITTFPVAMRMILAERGSTGPKFQGSRICKRICKAFADNDLIVLPDKQNREQILQANVDQHFLEELQAFDVCIPSWFPALATRASNRASVQSWLGQHEYEIVPPAAANEIRPFLRLLSRVWFGDLVRFRNLAHELMRVRLPMPLSEILDYMTTDIDRTSTVSVEGIQILVEMNRPNIHTYNIVQVHLNDTNLLSCLSRLEISTAWKLFRMIFGSNEVHPYVAMGALWIMRVKTRASLSSLINNMHRALIENTWLLKTASKHSIAETPSPSHSRYSQCLPILDLLLCMDSKGMMTTRPIFLPHRPMFVMYSMLFCVGAVEFTGV